jgi:hypothetical protein
VGASLTEIGPSQRTQQNPLFSTRDNVVYRIGKMLSEHRLYRRGFA